MSSISEKRKVGLFILSLVFATAAGFLIFVGLWCACHEHKASMVISGLACLVATGWLMRLMYK